MSKKRGRARVCGRIQGIKLNRHKTVQYQEIAGLNGVNCAQNRSKLRAGKLVEKEIRKVTGSEEEVANIDVGTGLGKQFCRGCQKQQILLLVGKSGAQGESLLSKEEKKEKETYAQKATWSGRLGGKVES